VNDAFYWAFKKKDLTLMNQTWWQGDSSICIHPGGKMIQGWEKFVPLGKKFSKTRIIWKSIPM
jgi:hypothetical protein